jgi:hypothetical protein
VSIAVVQSFTSDYGESPARTAGLSVGDAILAVNGLRVHHLAFADLMAHLRTAPRPIRITVLSRAPATPSLSVMTIVSPTQTQFQSPPMPRMSASGVRSRFSSTPHSGALLCFVVLCCAVLCCAVLCCAVLCCAVLCCAVLCCAVLCCAVPCRVSSLRLSRTHVKCGGGHWVAG